MICNAVRFDGMCEDSVNADSHVGGSGEALQANWISIGDGDGDGGKEMGVAEFFVELEKKKRKRDKNIREKYWDIILFEMKRSFFFFLWNNKMDWIIYR